MSMGSDMQRREFITIVVGAAAAWPFAAIAQQDQRMKLIGVFPSAGIVQSRVDVFLQAMQQLGWSDSRNVRFDIRWGAGDPETDRKRAEELVALAPAIIVAVGSAAVAALLQATRSVPVVFTAVVDPVSAGYVASLARPGGNATGFLLFEYGVSGKWLELLKQIAPSLKRAAVLRDPTIPAGIGQFAIIQSVSPSLGVDVIPFGVADAAEIERSIATFADSPNGGLILTASGSSLKHRDLVVALAARYKLPAVYWDREMVGGGGLMAYGPDVPDQYRRAAGYVDRILKGEKPADLPVQAPTKYELTINLKTAKALGLDVPPALLASADELIE
jgi:putative tryptophan/tyrosine transport system substrate-binding protein